MPDVSILQSGWLAEETFRQHSTLKALGATSKAVYLLSPAGQVVILSFDSYISPLTCTLDRFSPQLRAITPGEVFEVSASALTHPTAVVWRNAAITWNAPPASGKILPAPTRLALIQRAAETATHPLQGQGFGCLLLPFLTAQPPGSDALEVYSHLMALHTILRTGAVELAVSPLTALLGLGRGLTPSGDDLLCGLLLLLNRWPLLSPLSAPLLETFNQQVTALARQRTTTLSANLLELAACGSGDERLIAAVDGLVTSDPQQSAWLPALLTYGSSSGTDALLGMALALRAHPEISF